MTSVSRVEMMEAVPAPLRGKIVSGMRWTLWFSILTAPLGYVTTVLLARVGPNVIGTYGLLQLYINLTSVFLFLGGNAVAIKFLPQVPREKQISFLASYFIVVCLATLPYQMAASIWPAKLQYFLGKEASATFEILLIWLAPLYILLSLTQAALDGLMDIKTSVAFSRILTIGSFLIYLMFFIFARPFLVRHYDKLIWGVYFLFAVALVVLAARRILRLTQWNQSGRELTFFLPRGFWKFTLGLQASSVLGFLSTNLDAIFVLNAGGLATLGRFVALFSLLSPIPLFATFMMNSMLPSLTNTLAIKDHAASRQLTEVYLRFILPCGLGAGCFAMLFAGPLIRLLGSKYADLLPLFLFAVPFAGTQVLNWFAGSMLTAVGLPHQDAVSKTVRTIIYCVAFWMLWGKFHLWAAILAWSLAVTSYQVMALVLLLRNVPFRFSIFRTYVPFLAVLGLTALATSYFPDRSYVFSAGLFLVLFAGFGVLAGYRWSEVRQLVKMVTPDRARAMGGRLVSVVGRV